jgi:diguanylate cyclase (GGDEF)-like protein
MEWALALSAVFVYRQIELNRLSFAQSLIVPYFFAFVVVFGTFVTPLHNGLFIWTFILPTIFYLLYGKEHGFWAALILVSIQVVNILSKESSALYDAERIATNFVLAYLTLWVVSRAYEINRKKNQEALQELALKDSLTHAYNRLALKKRFDEKTASAQHLSLVLLDIDFFKKINDKHGHEAGDYVLTELTKIMQKVAGEHNVFRLGGEEFCLLLELSKAEAAKVAEAFKATLAATQFHYKHDVLRCTFSGGIAECGHNTGKSLSELLAEADNRLYQAKRNGRNQMVAD